MTGLREKILSAIQIFQPNKKIVIRYAVENDYSNVRFLIEDLFLFHTKKTSDINNTEDLYPKEKFLTDVSNKYLLIAELNMQVVAIVRYYEKKRSVYNHSILYVNGLYVKKEFRRKKIASTLIDRLIQEARIRKINRIELQVENWNKSAKQFYKRKGFGIKSLRFQYKV